MRYGVVVWKLQEHDRRKTQQKKGFAQLYILLKAHSKWKMKAEDGNTRPQRKYEMDSRCMVHGAMPTEQ